MKRSLLLAMALLVSWLTSVQAAGFQLVTVPVASGQPMQLAIWYPSAATPSVTSMGLGVQTVATNAEIKGSSLPLVIFSHGTGGSAFSHFDTALTLANAGFIVAAVTHPGDNYADKSRSVLVLERPRHVTRAIDYLLADWPGHGQIDVHRIGMFGFSAGGFTTLLSAGGRPDFSKIGPHCATHQEDFACKLLSGQKGPAPKMVFNAADGLKETRLRAAVVAAPALGFTFGGDGLQDVQIPIQLWRAEEDTLLPHPWYAEVVRQSLPVPPEYHVVPKAGHYDFLSTCTERLAAVAPEICASQQGFDRSAFHDQFNAGVLAFFTRTLGR